jgi:uncharacterized protein YutE (UPF0331/DUF86 family)
MSPINREVIDKKFERLKEVIGKLEKVNNFSKEDFLSDFFVNDTAVRNLILGIEIVTDIGNHILAEVFQKSAKSYKDVILELGKTGVVPDEFAKVNSAMADFRNLAIHAYDDLEIEKIYDYSQKAPEIFGKFAKYFFEFLKDKSK